MHKNYKDYYWKEGVPKGIDPHDENSGYRIIGDPYHKRYSIELYEQGKFVELLYDSALFDFRLLKEEEQTAWRKTVLEENQDKIVSLIYNQDDRLLIKESCFFENGRCRRTEAHHPYGTLVSTQKIFYESLGDAFNGVILFDRTERVVLKKEYAIDEESGEFAALLKKI